MSPRFDEVARLKELECGDSPAEALLAAYIAAVKGEKK